eukprot:2881485-Amphidinium_carterae.1
MEQAREVVALPVTWVEEPAMVAAKAMTTYQRSWQTSESAKEVCGGWYWLAPKTTSMHAEV